jgi:hypothetical protein
MSVGPLKIPIKVGYRFWAFWALGGGLKSAQKRVSRVDWYPTSQKIGGQRAVEGWTWDPTSRAFKKIIKNHGKS